MFVDDDGREITDEKLPIISKKLPFGVRHPVLRGLFTMILGFVAVAVIDIIFFIIGGTKMMERFGIIPVAIGILFFLKGYVQMLYPPRY